jgi:two-component system sensor histidine kinase DesK
MTWSVRNIVAIMILGSCLNFLIMTEASIFAYDGPIESPALLAAMTRLMAVRMANSDAEMGLLWQRFYALAYGLVFVGYACSYWLGNMSDRRIPASAQWSLWTLQFICCVIGLDLLYQLLIAELAFRLPLRQAAVSLVAMWAMSTFTNAAYMCGWTGMRHMEYAGRTWLYLSMLGEISGMTCFFGIGYLAGVASRARRAISAAHADLLATQQLLAEAVRDSERQRIARDLHDSLGHTVTAMNLQLDLAARQGIDKVLHTLRSARQLGDELLKGVRIVVGNERHKQPLDVAFALKTLCRGIPEPQLTLDIAPSLIIDDAGIAHALFRCAQEGITNAVRHAQARSIRVRLWTSDDMASLTVTDDGKGTLAGADGNGLKGMRERVDELGGAFEFGASENGGCRVQVDIPLRRVSS